MHHIGSDSYDDEANESALDAYSEFLDLQTQALNDSGDLDYLDRQLIQSEPFAYYADDGLESAIAYDEAIAKIVYGHISEKEKLEIASQFGITSNDVFEYEFGSMDDVEELDELEYRRLEEEKYLLDRKEFGYENF
jgi:hypothetical protein